MKFRPNALLKRLTCYNHPAERVVDDSRLHRIERIRLQDIIEALNEGRATQADKCVLPELLNRCVLVSPSQARPGYTETIKDRVKRTILDEAFAATLRDFAERHPDIAIPSYDNELDAYQRYAGCELFNAYGWVRGDSDSSAITALDRWMPRDRERLIELYRQSKPEDATKFPPGWQTKYISTTWKPFG